MLEIDSLSFLITINARLDFISYLVRMAFDNSFSFFKLLHFFRLLCSLCVLAIRSCFLLFLVMAASLLRLEEDFFISIALGI